KLDVHLLERDKVLRLKPMHQIFCRERMWDQWAEVGFMKQIEDRFQPIAEAILGGKSLLSPEEHNNVSAFYALWSVRARAEHVPDQTLHGLRPGAQTKDQRELMESRRMITSYGKDGAKGADAVMPGRHLNSIGIRFRVDRALRDLNGRRWGI